jgi:hypothetical protein
MTPADVLFFLVNSFLHRVAFANAIENYSAEPVRSYSRDKKLSTSELK